MSTLVLFWCGVAISELLELARMHELEFDDVIVINSHWLTPRHDLRCIHAQEFTPASDRKYIVAVTAEADHMQTIPVIATLSRSGAEFAAYEFFYRDLRQIFPPT